MALQALHALGYEPAAPVTLQSVVEEECTGNGALACLVEGYTADAATITEPTPGIMRAQMGVIWLSIEVALQQLGKLMADGAPRYCVLADAGYGVDNSFRQALTDMELTYVVGVTEPPQGGSCP